MDLHGGTGSDLLFYMWLLFVPNRRHTYGPPRPVTGSIKAVTMKNTVFWDMKTQFVLHRRHITSPLQSQASQCYVRFEVFTAVTMKNAVFWDVTQCGSSKNRRFGGNTSRRVSVVRYG
jgi:hypothetical protein